MKIMKFFLISLMRATTRKFLAGETESHDMDARSRSRKPLKDTEQMNLRRS